MDNKNQPGFPLDKLDHNLLPYLANYLSPLDKKHLATIGNRYLFSLFKADIKRAKPLIEKFLLHVVHGEQDQAHEMLKKDPGLLLQKGLVTDYSGRKIFGTALQIALGAQDIRYQPNEICMVELIEYYFNQLPNGNEVMLKQIREQFPDGWEKAEKERAQRDSLALQKVVEAIIKAKTFDPCDAALQEFRDYLQPKNIIKTGRHFNISLLLEAYKAFETNYESFGLYGTFKNNLLWCKVIGYIQRFLPACYAQATCQGYSFIVKESEKLNRLFKPHMRDWLYFESGSVKIELGYHHAIGTWGGRGSVRNIGFIHPEERKYLNIIANKKQQRCEDLQNELLNVPKVKPS